MPSTSQAYLPTTGEQHFLHLRVQPRERVLSASLVSDSQQLLYRLLCARRIQCKNQLVSERLGWSISCERCSLETFGVHATFTMRACAVTPVREERRMASPLCSP